MVEYVWTHFYAEGCIPIPRSHTLKLFWNSERQKAWFHTLVCATFLVKNMESLGQKLYANCMLWAQKSERELTFLIWCFFPNNNSAFLLYNNVWLIKISNLNNWEGQNVYGGQIHPMQSKCGLWGGHPW